MAETRTCARRRLVYAVRWRRARRRTTWRDFAALGAVLGAMVTSAAAWTWAGLLLNHTASLPRGLYRVDRIASRTAASPETLPTRGAVVVWCLPPDLTAFARLRGYLVRGGCSAGGEPILKLVAAVPGDTVRVDTVGMAVNGARLPNSRPLNLDSRGRPTQSVPAGVYPVRSGQVWLWSPYTAHSFDSRYYGALPIGGWVGTARPLLVSGGRR